MIVNSRAEPDNVVSYLERAQPHVLSHGLNILLPVRGSERLTIVDKVETHTRAKG